MIGVDVIPTIERNGRDKQDVIDEHNAKVQTIENMYWQNPAVAKQSQDIGNSHIEWINNLTTHYPDLLKNIVNPEKISQIIQNEINAWNLVLNPDGTIKEVLVEINGEKKPSQLFAKMKADWFSGQKALKTWLQVRTPEFKNRFGDWQSADKSQVSKVVDDNGEPLVVYHGSRTEIQDGIFKLPKDIEQTKTPMEWISTTTSKQVAIDYANKYHGGFEWGVIYPLFINIKNSISLDTVWEYSSYARYLRTSKWLSTKYNIHSYQELKEFENHMQENTNTYLSQDQVSWKWNTFSKDEFVELWASGFDLWRFVEKDNAFWWINIAWDWVIFNPHIDGNFSAATSVPYDQQLIFDPKNIKSAIDNDWSFSPETAKFNDYFWKESRFWFDSKQARDHSAFMDQFYGQATPEQITQIREKIQAVAQIYSDKTGKPLELSDTQIQAIIDTHLLPWQLGKLTQAELIAKNRKLVEAISDSDVRRFLLEAGFSGKDRMNSNTEEMQKLLWQIFELWLQKSLDREAQDILQNSLFTKTKPKIWRSEGIKINEFIQNSIQTIDSTYNKIYEIKIQLSNNMQIIINHMQYVSNISSQSLDQCFHNLWNMTSTINNIHEEIHNNLLNLIETYSNNLEVVNELQNIKNNIENEFNELWYSVSSFQQLIHWNYEMIVNSWMNDYLQNSISWLPKANRDLIEIYTKLNIINDYTKKSLDELFISINKTYHQ